MLKFLDDIYHLTQKAQKHLLNLNCVLLLATETALVRRGITAPADRQEWLSLGQLLRLLLPAMPAASGEK